MKIDPIKLLQLVMLASLPVSYLLLGPFGTLVTLIIWVLIGFSTYTIVRPGRAHFVVSPTEIFVASPDEGTATEGRRSYFKIPAFIPIIGRMTRTLDITIREIVEEQETIEKSQARYNVISSTKYAIKDVKIAAQKFTTESELQEQLREVIRSTVRNVTVKFTVIEARADKEKVNDAVEKLMTKDIAKWGLELINFQLVEFQDTKDSHIVSDISKMREAEIQANRRQHVAEKMKQARVKEAEAEEVAKQREIEKDQKIGEREQLKAQKIAEQEKLAQEKHYEVVRVETIKQQEIDKDQQIVLATQNRETEKIKKDQKKLEGEGDRVRAEEQAIGDAAPILQKGLAEAQAKEKLQSALNKFTPSAITALVAEQVVEKDKSIGIATAQALEKADLKVFAGTSTAKQGFDLASIVASAQVADDTTANAILNKLARPQDLGFKGLGLQKAKELVETEEEKPIKKKGK